MPQLILSSMSAAYLGYPMPKVDSASSYNIHMHFSRTGC